MRTQITVGGNRVNQIRGQIEWVVWHRGADWRILAAQQGAENGCVFRICWTMGEEKLVMIDMSGQGLPSPFHLWELWLALPFTGGKQASVEKTAPHMATEVCSWCKQSDVEILTLDSYLTKFPGYRSLCSLIIAASYQEVFSSQAEQAPWPRASGSSAALPQKAAESYSMRRRDEEEQKWEIDTWLQTAQRLLSFLLQCRSHRFWLHGSEAHEFWVNWSESQQVLHCGVSFS